MGFSEVEKTYVENRFALTKENDPDHYKRIQEVIKKRYNLKAVNFRKDFGNNALGRSRCSICFKRRM